MLLQIHHSHTIHRAKSTLVLLTLTRASVKEKKKTTEEEEKEKVLWTLDVHPLARSFLFPCLLRSSFLLLDFSPLSLSDPSTLEHRKEPRSGLSSERRTTAEAWPAEREREGEERRIPNRKRSGEAGEEEEKGLFPPSVPRRTYMCISGALDTSPPSFVL